MTKAVKLSFRVGDLVTYVYGGNGTGEGIIWRVTRVWAHHQITIVPAYTVTGPSCRAPLRAHVSSVVKLDLVKLGTMRMELDDLIRKHVAESIGLTEEEAKCSSST